jgi:hypothetical protein
LKLNTLTPEEKRLIVRKGTERPFTGAYEVKWGIRWRGQSVNFAYRYSPTPDCTIGRLTPFRPFQLPVLTSSGKITFAAPLWEAGSQPRGC